MRVQVSYRLDWLATAKANGYDNDVWQFIPPFDVAADIMRYLLGMIEGRERAEAWQPRWVSETREFAPLLQPIMVDWRKSELVRWVEDYRSDTNSNIGFFHSQANGSIDIYATPFTLVGMNCENPVNGAIELIPYVLEGATDKAITELQEWRDALEAAVLATNRQSGKSWGVNERDYIPSDLPEELHELWLSTWMQREAGRLSSAFSRAYEDMRRTLDKPAEKPDRRKKKDTVCKLIMAGHTLKEIADGNMDIPYSTARVLRDELIAEGRLPQEVKKTRKKLDPDSI